MGVIPPFQSFMDEHAPMVHRFLAASVPAHEVDDCFQETFISALKAYPKLTDDSNLRAWVMTIAARKAIDGHRRRARLDVSSNGLPEVAAPEAPETDPELWGLVRELPVKQRGAVVLRFVNDLSYREIGKVLDCSEAAARQSAKAGLDRLREVWS
jgi:RNA polymerase sigma factor (sigma-70 family)